MKIYYKTRKEAIAAAKAQNDRHGIGFVSVYKMSKGTRHHGQYAVCDHLYFINFAN